MNKKKIDKMIDISGECKEHVKYGCPILYFDLSIVSVEIVVCSDIKTKGITFGVLLKFKKKNRENYINEQL